MRECVANRAGFAHNTPNYHKTSLKSNAQAGFLLDERKELIQLLLFLQRSSWNQSLIT